MKRIVIAFLTAIVGVVMSWIFLRPDEWTTSGNANRQTIAKVLDIKNEVNRQNDGRLLWNPLRIGDQIYIGDKIKTSGLSSVSLQFLDSVSKLEIEENSTIKMETKGKKLSMNMLEGRIFLNQEKVDIEEKVELFSSGKKIDTQGSVVVSVGQDGMSKVESLKNSSEKNFQDLEPFYGQEIKSVDYTVKLQWQPMGKDEEVFVEVGESPLLLSKSIEKGFVMDGKLIVSMNPGVNYWRLVTKKDLKEVRSPIMRITMTKPFPPRHIYPSQDEVINLKDKTFEYKWGLGNAGDSIVLEVSRDSTFKKILETIEVKNQTFHPTVKFYEEGTYFWKLKTKIEESGAWIETKATSFKVVHGANLLSPQPISPLDGAVYYLGSSSLSVIKFEWQKQEETRNYEIVISGPDYSKKIQQTIEFAKLNLTREGKYNWYTTSESKEGKTSSFPVKRSFIIKKNLSIQWKNQEKYHHYLDNFPIVILEWDRIAGQSYVLKVSKRSDMGESEVFQVQGNDFPYRPMRDGFHYAQVISIDESGQTSGDSEVYEFKIEKAPLPPTPIMSHDGKFFASSRGELLTDVKNHKGSWTILSQVVNSKGTIVDERKFFEPRIKFNGLMPGIYSLQSVFQDQYQRKSDSPSVVEIIVPDKSMIAAPRIKGIKVR
jgi:hypothetical protein